MKVLFGRSALHCAAIFSVEKAVAAMELAAAGGLEAEVGPAIAWPCCCISRSLAIIQTTGRQIA